jgi:cytochrome P450
VITEAEARELPYLQGVIKEGLRIFPPVTGLLMKQVPPEGDVINGMFVPGGTRIGTSAWGIQRNKNVYGNDADLFRPERWLHGAVDADRRSQMDKCLEVVFSFGRYTCLGKPVALIELNKVFVEVGLLEEVIEMDWELG